MKTRIRKIIIMAMALFFVSVSPSFARDLKVNSKKVSGDTSIQDSNPCLSAI